MQSKLLNTIGEHLNSEKGFALFRLPGDKDFNFISGNVSDYRTDESFCINPFNGSECLFINGSFNKIKSLNQLNNSSEYKLPNEEPYSSSKEKYIEGFELIIKNISEDNIQKAILSRKIDLELSYDFNLDSFFMKLTSNFPQAYVFIFYTPYSGCWVGASPEKLIEQQGETYKTISLAGTKNNELSDWTEKELEEQKIVTDNIVKTLNLKNKKVEIGDLQTVKTGNLFHLKNEISFKGKQNELFDLANSLHPTPAIGGFPKSKAFDVIKQAENHSREYYCGFAGPITKEHSELFVLIRCLKLYNNKVSIYAGGGITSKSDLEKEWEECERKANSIGQFL